MNLYDLGYNIELEKYYKEQNLESFEIGRVIAEHKERYIVLTANEEFDAEVIGNIRYTANDRSDFPAVGDWVAFSPFDNKALIHAIFPRKTIIERQAVGKFGQKQIIAVNVDTALIVQAVDRDFNINRIERYLTICYNANITPIILLNKTDLITHSELTSLISQIEERIKNVTVLPISNQNKTGYEKLSTVIQKGKTYCLLGSSGVGKSTLTNNLIEKNVMKTGIISDSTNKGRHITSHREIFLLNNGALLIDNPGMREVGISDSSSGFDTTFSSITEAAQYCKYKDCTHTTEAGCEVLKRIELGQIDPDTYQNYLKIEKEKTHFESDAAQRKKKDKDFGKMLKNFKKDMSKVNLKHK